ncbi:MAG: nitrous oxide reductase accessory protein NosL [Candidatus Kapaibacterium sp.]
MKYLTLLLVVCAVALQSCSKHEPIPIDYNKDNCENCMMSVSDQKYACELVTNKGKYYKFDSPECMAAFYSTSKTITPTDVEQLWVTDFVNPGKFIDAKKAFYLESTMLRSPMGMNYAAFETKEALQAAITSFPGEIRTFDNAIEYVKKEWAEGDSMHQESGDSTNACAMNCEADDSCACNHRNGEACGCKHHPINKCQCKHDSTTDKCACKH